MWENMDTSMSQAGGFLNESISQSDGNENKGNRSRKANSVVPLMIGHIINSRKDQSEDLSIGNLPVHIISILGIVRDVQQTTTKATYEIEDETGTITAVKWLEADKQPSEGSLEVNVYVRVHGMVRNHNDKRHILILSIVPMEDLNELTNHLLEVTYVILQAKKMTKIEAKPQNISSIGNTEDSNYNSFTPDQLEIYNIIRDENDSDCGIERATIKARVSARIKPSIDKILEFLVTEGHIYTTLTDDHFKTT